MHVIVGKLRKYYIHILFDQFCFHTLFSELNLDDKDNNRLTLFERSATENYLNISHKLAREELNNKVANTADRYDIVHLRITELGIVHSVSLMRPLRCELCKYMPTI